MTDLDLSTKNAAKFPGISQETGAGSVAIPSPS
jgi:hypothetical protein